MKRCAHISPTEAGKILTHVLAILKHLRPIPRHTGKIPQCPSISPPRLPFSPTNHETHPHPTHPLGLGMASPRTGGRPHQIPRLRLHSPHRHSTGRPASPLRAHGLTHPPRPRQQCRNHALPHRLQPRRRLLRLGLAHLLHVHPRAQLLPQPQRTRARKLLPLALRVAPHQQPLGQGRVHHQSRRTLSRHLRRTHLLQPLRLSARNGQQLRLDDGLRQMVRRHVQPHVGTHPSPHQCRN